MLYQEHSPHPGLQNYIKFYWTLMISSSMIPKEGQYFLAEGFELAINFGDPIEFVTGNPSPGISRHSCLCGPMTQPMRIKPLGKVEVLGICFRPGGAYPFFYYPAVDLVNGYAKIDDFWGVKGLGVVDRIQNGCRTTEERISFLDYYFLRMLDRNQRSDPSVALALEMIESFNGQVNISRLAGLVGLSSRQLERRFKERVGMSPKQLCRSLRFKNIFKYYATSPTRCWASTAQSCGYYDQSHLIKDFKHYVGSSPLDYFKNPAATENFFMGNF